MDGILHPIEWRALSASTDPIPVAWGGWFNGQWIVVHACFVGD